MARGMHAEETANEAGGKHPTGMHSSFQRLLVLPELTFA